MAKDDSQKGSAFESILAMLAGIVAVKLVTYIVTTAWRLVTREEPPQADEPHPIGKKAAWVAIFGASTGAARQIARDLVKHPGEPSD